MKKILIQKPLILSILIFVIGITLNIFMSGFIDQIFPSRPFIPDLFGENLPFIDWLQYLSDPLLMLSILTGLYYVAKYDQKRLPEGFFISGFMLMMRALLIVLNPTARPYSLTAHYGIFQEINLHGTFPSGHTASAALAFFFVKEKYKHIKLWAFILLLGQMLVLLLSAGHYSMDIVGGLMIAYIAHRKGSDYEKNLQLQYRIK